MRWRCPQLRTCVRRRLGRVRGSIPAAGQSSAMAVACRASRARRTSSQAHYLRIADHRVPNALRHGRAYRRESSPMSDSDSVVPGARYDRLTTCAITHSTDGSVQRLIPAYLTCFESIRLDVRAANYLSKPCSFPSLQRPQLFWRRSYRLGASGF